MKGKNSGTRLVSFFSLVEIPQVPVWDFKADQRERRFYYIFEQIQKKKPTHQCHKSATKG